MGLNESNQNNSVIIAVDGRQPEEISDILEQIKNECSEHIDRILIKFNDQLFRLGANGIADLMNQNEGFDTMEDPKLHDIASTVAHSIKQLAESSLASKTKYLTIHASGGADMIKAAIEERNKLELSTKILAVTVLTSLGEVGAQDSFDETAKHGVLKFAKMALENGADGIVCSPLESPILRAVFGEKYPDFEIVTPGIRFNDSELDYQTRRKDPAGAIAGGSTDLVMGSDILKKNEDGTINNVEMIEAINRFFTEIDGIVYEAEKEKYEFERILYTGEWEELLRYIGAFYFRPEGGKYCKLASKLLSNAYINIGATERDYLVLEKAAREMATKLKTTLSLDKVPADKIDETMGEYVVMGAQMGSVRISGYLAEKMGIQESIYTEKSNPSDERIEIIKKYMNFAKESNGNLSKEKMINDLTDLLEKDIKEQMLLKRHDIDLTGKKVILSEDIITKGSTLDKMIKLVADKGGEVVAISCVGKRYPEDNFKGIPIIYCYNPPAFELYYNDDTPEENRENHPRLPEGAQISKKPKNDWPELVGSMR